MFQWVLEIRPALVEKCIKATCILHNFLRASAGGQVLRRAAAPEKPLPDLGRVGANNAVRGAIGVREVFTAFFSGEGAVPWQIYE